MQTLYQLSYQGSPPVIWLWLRPNCGGVNGGDDDLFQKDLCWHTLAPGLLCPVPLTLGQAIVEPCFHWRLLDTHRHVWLSLLWGHCSFLLGSGGHKVLFVPLRVCFPVLWKFCNQISLASKVKFPGGSQSLCRIPRLGSLLWAL